MANLNLGQNEPNKGDRKQTAAHIVVAVKICRCGSLIKINLSCTFELRTRKEGTKLYQVPTYYYTTRYKGKSLARET